MADIDLERTEGGMSWLWWAIVLLAIVLIAWWAWPDVDSGLSEAERDVETEQVVPATAPGETAESPAGTPGEASAETASPALGEILANPDSYVGRSFPGGEVQVGEVPSDRGFWIEDQGERLFAIIVDEPRERPKDINPGQRLRIEGGTLRDASFLEEMPGDPLDEDTRRMAEQQDVYLVVDEENISVLEGGQPQPGTDPAIGVEGR